MAKSKAEEACGAARRAVMAVSLSPLERVVQWDRDQWRIRTADKARLPLDCARALRPKWLAQELLYGVTATQPRHCYYVVLRQLVADVVANSQFEGARVVRLLYHWTDLEAQLDPRTASDTLTRLTSEAGILRAALAYAREGRRP